ncbi:MAG: hypothetical protein K8R40_12995 [Anaerolineaceae bacterium]|nr:hypothetical protein [Anaerolineaceae bacterium]
MNENNKKIEFPKQLILGLGGLIIIIFSALLIWAISLHQSISDLKTESTALAAELTLAILVNEQVAEQITQEATETKISEPTALPPTSTTMPTATPDLLTDSSFNQIQFEFVPVINELSDQRHFLIPPLHITFPDGWAFLFDETGQLTITAPNETETQLFLHMENSVTADIFNLNTIGSFGHMINGDLVWHSPNFDEFPPEITPGEYKIMININGADYYNQTFLLEEAPQARILQSAPMFRTMQDLLNKQKYRSFADQQENMPMLGYTVLDDGRLFIRLWRPYDQYFYWVNGEYVMHPTLAIAYNTLEDLRDESDQWLIPEIVIP